MLHDASWCFKQHLGIFSMRCLQIRGLVVQHGLGVPLSMKPWTSLRNGSKELDPGLKAATFHGQNFDRKSQERTQEKNGMMRTSAKEQQFFPHLLWIFLWILNDLWNAFLVCDTASLSLSCLQSLLLPLSNGWRSGTLHGMTMPWPWHDNGMTTAWPWHDHEVHFEVCFECGSTLFTFLHFGSKSKALVRGPAETSYASFKLLWCRTAFGQGLRWIRYPSRSQHVESIAPNNASKNALHYTVYTVQICLTSAYSSQKF